MLQVSHVRLRRVGSHRAAPCSQIYNATDLQHLPLPHPESCFGMCQGPTGLLIPTMARAAQPGVQSIPRPRALSPAKVLLRTDSCSASSLLLLLGFPLFSPPTRLFLFLTAPITFTAAIKGTEKFCHCIRAGNSFKSSRENSLFIDTSNREEENRPTAL